MNNFGIVAELVYATDLKSVARMGLRVRVPPMLPKYGPIVYRFRTPGFHPGKRGSIPLGTTIHGPLAQLVRAPRS